MAAVSNCYNQVEFMQLMGLVDDDKAISFSLETVNIQNDHLGISVHLHCRVVWAVLPRYQSASHWHCHVLPEKWVHHLLSGWYILWRWPWKWAVEQALSSLLSAATVEDLKNNIQIYMEATISCTKCNAIASGPEIMVITDDHTFFRIFASSPTAENIKVS